MMIPSSTPVRSEPNPSLLTTWNGNAEKHNQCPLPSRGVDHHAEHEPVDQLGVSKDPVGRTTLDEYGPVDPFLRHEEREKQARIDFRCDTKILSGVSLPF